MGKWHAKNAVRIAGVKVVAVCDIDEEKIKEGKKDGFVTYSLPKNF
ncbi:hypothetical protein [Thermoanaerobacterium sp. PSU-2]|nr:hypothetical protein [Thermoanaerobacterium sp. PSU-2]